LALVFDIKSFTQRQRTRVFGDISLLIKKEFN